MKYVIMGDPVSLARPRFGKGRVYDSQKHKKLVAGINLRNQHNDEPFYEGSLHMTVHFYLKISKKRDFLLRHKEWHNKRPDLDNLVKWLCDISSNIIYYDDAIICSIEATKHYDREPRTEFEIREL